MYASLVSTAIWPQYSTFTTPGKPRRIGLLEVKGRVLRDRAGLTEPPSRLGLPSREGGATDTRWGGQARPVRPAACPRATSGGLRRMVRQQFAKLRPGNWSCGFDPHTLRHARHITRVVCFAVRILPC